MNTFHDKHGNLGIWNTDKNVCATETSIYAVLLRRLILLCFVLSSQYHLYGQSNDAASGNGRPFRLGLWGSYGMNTHTADFPELSGYPIFSPRTSFNQGPANFRAGAGTGLSLGAVYEMPLAQSLSLAARLSYTAHDGLLTTSDKTLLGDAQGNVIDALHEYRLSAHLASLGADVGVKWTPVGGLFIAAGVRGAWMLQSTFSQDERLVAVNSATSLSGGFDKQTFPRVRNEQEGAIPTLAPMQFWGSASLGYEIPLGMMRLAPEVGYMLGLTSLLSGGTVWRTDQLRAGVSVLFTFQALSNGVLQMSDDAFDEILESRPLPRTVSPDTTILANNSKPENSTRTNPPSTNNESKNPTTATERTPVSVARPTLDVQTFGIVRTAQRSSKERGEKEQIEEKREQSVILPKQEVIVRHNYSLLPYIFFDGDRSAAIPQRYARLSTEATAQFAAEKLRVSTTLTAGEHPYYHLLNIVGQRMKRFPEAKLNILGGIDGASGERDNLRVARQRASAVAMYLRTVWGIDSVRLVMGEARLTAKSGRMFNEQDRQAENRRVELSSDTTALLEPVQLFDTVQRSAPLRVRFLPTLRGANAATPAITSWTLALRQEDRTIKELRGDSTLPATLDWRADERELALLRIDKPLQIALTAQEKSGMSLTAPVRSLPITSRVFRVTDEEYCENVLIEKYNLILFDATKSSVAQTQALTLKALNARITARSKVLVEGYMDKSDDEDANRRLSRARAQSAAQSLKSFVRGAQLEVQGYGSQKPLYDERLPEGRMYSRTVLLTVETPLGEDWQK
jgi:outer membrane protein OmpA-like peptidoglycan-associated protein